MDLDEYCQHNIDLSLHVTQVSHKMPKFARYCVRLLKRKKQKSLGSFLDFPEVTGVPEEGVEPTPTVK
jgi:hypothetical protein